MNIRQEERFPDFAELTSAQITTGKSWDKRSAESTGIGPESESERAVWKQISNLRKDAAEDVRKAQHLKAAYDALETMIADWKKMENNGQTFVKNGRLVGRHTGIKESEEKEQKAETDNGKSMSTSEEVDTDDVATRYADSDGEGPINIESPPESDGQWAAESEGGADDEMDDNGMYSSDE